MLKKILFGGIAIGLVGFVLLSCGAEPKAKLIRQVEWVNQGTWLKADIHIHTKFSDGRHTVAEVVAKAVAFGCQVVAITDHSDRKLKAATQEYFAAIDAARRKYPETIILSGVEWNIPPWGGDEHANVIIPPASEKGIMLTEANESFDSCNPLSVVKHIFDDYKREIHDAALADACLRWLKKNGAADGVDSVVIYNHPSRKDSDSLQNVADIQRWRTVNDLVIGFEGSPGHQGDAPLGSYKYDIQLIDRWDPAAARVGDAWDTLLQKGIDVWAAFASSDFHNADPKPRGLNDRWPGQFSETWLYVPEQSPSGVLRALRAGTFFAVHGHVARDVDFTVEAPGLPRSATVGEVIGLSAPSRVTARVRLTIPPNDWEGNANTIDALELISITPKEAKVLVSTPPTQGEIALTVPVDVPEEGMVLRLRGRRVIADGPDLMFYTNPVRIKVL